MHETNQRDTAERLGSVSDGRITLSHTFVVPVFTAGKKCSCDIKFVKWLVRKKRALSMSKIFKFVKQIQTWGDERIRKTVTALTAEGIKISITVDIWYSFSYVCAYFLQYTF